MREHNFSSIEDFRGYVNTSLILIVFDMVLENHLEEFLYVVQSVLDYVCYLRSIISLLKHSQ
uniref:Uncharacterized protein n=1 Tax=Arundo donax TaxID=35708 RepID=A0A0A9AVV4_ARUDO